VYLINGAGSCQTNPRFQGAIMEMKGSKILLVDDEVVFTTLNKPRPQSRRGLQIEAIAVICALRASALKILIKE